MGIPLSRICSKSEQSLRLGLHFIILRYSRIYNNDEAGVMLPFCYPYCSDVICSMITPNHGQYKQEQEQCIFTVTAIPWMGTTNNENTLLQFIKLCAQGNGEAGASSL